MAAAEPSLAWQYVERWAERQPDAEALVFGDRRVSWREFRDRVDAFARGLIEAGVGKGDRIALLAMGCPEFPVSFMAAAKIGAVWLGLSPKFTLRELVFILRDARPTVLVSLRQYGERDLAPDLQALRREVPGIRTLIVIGEPFDGAEPFDAVAAAQPGSTDDALGRRAAEVVPDDNALLMYTSGSTGTPKGVVHTHRSMLLSVATQNARFGLSPGSRILMDFPINHVAADVEIGLAAICAGAALVIMDRFDPALSLQIVERERVTLLGGVPAMFMMQFGSPEFPRVSLASVETFVWAGSPAPRTVIDVLAAIAGRTGARLLTGYGSTEAGGFVTFTDPGDDVDTLADTAGRVAPPTELRIVDEARRDVPDGQPGEIALRGPTLMRGYWNNPEATAQAVDAEGWYYTGDVALRDRGGRIRIVGRTSEMYKSGGENVHPREVEQALEAHPAVALAAVVGVPDDVFQESGLAFVVLRPGAGATDGQLRAHCRSLLANFKVPKRFEFRPGLPLLPNGKVDKVALRREVVDSAPRSPRR